MASTTGLDEISNRLTEARLDEIVVSFQDRQLKLNTEADAKEVVDTLNSNKDLTILCLANNTLGHDAAKPICKALESCSKLKRAQWKDLFTGRSKLEIPPVLGLMSDALIAAQCHLVELDLSDNAFGKLGVDAFYKLLVSPVCYTLQELRLNNNGLGIGGGQRLAEAFNELLDNSKGEFRLQTFICGRNRLENDGATALGKFFKRISSLQEVSMRQNGIFHVGISALAEGLVSHKGLRILDLNDNIFTETGAKAFAKVLPSFTELEILDFGDCILKNAGMLAICEALKSGKHSKLREINVGFNQFDAETGIKVMEALAGKNNMERIELDGNSFGATGIERIEKTAESLGLLEPLCSFTDDEGGESDEGEGDGDGGEEQDTSRDSKPTNHKAAAPSPAAAKEEIDAETFFASPSTSKLRCLGDSRREKVASFMKNEPQEIGVYFRRFLELSQTVNDPNNGDLVREAEQCCDVIIAGLFELANQRDEMTTLRNYVIVNLGLIKNEDKTNHGPDDLRGPLLMLALTAKKPYFDSLLKDMLQMFLSKPNPNLTKCGQTLHKVMQLLFQG